MRHLSGLDATFLHVESPEMPMHIGSLNVVDLPVGFEGEFYDNVKRHMAQRMHLAEMFTRKLALMPFDLSNPVWVDDEDIDLDYHIRHITLPKPGSNHQLQQYVARLHSSLLDRSRPLWEIYVIDGLKSGQVALYIKAHHAGMDGQAGVAVAKAVFDLGPEGRTIKPPRPRVRRHQYQLGVAELAGAAVANTVRQVVSLVKTAPAMGRALVDVLLPTPDENGKRQLTLPKTLNPLGPRTVLNVSITNQRSFAGRTISMAETKLIGKAFGASLNDVVMCTTAGALRQYLKDHNDLPDKSLVAAVPVSLREAGDASANNQVSMMTMTLATHIKDPVARLAAIRSASVAKKATMARVKTAIPTDFPLLGAPWLVSGVATLVGRSGLLNLFPPVANVLISNVPGSPVPLYFAGARLACYYPVSIPAHSMALNVTVQSYAGRLDYGLIACRRAVPDIGDLGDYLLAEHAVLLERAQAHMAETAAVPLVATRAPAKRAAARAKSPAVAKPRKPAATQKAAAPSSSQVEGSAAKPAAKKGSTHSRKRGAGTSTAAGGAGQRRSTAKAATAAAA